MRMEEAENETEITMRHSEEPSSMGSWLRLDTDGPTPDNLREMLRNI